jgi:autotransporter adhesin
MVVADAIAQRATRTHLSTKEVRTEIAMKSEYRTISNRGFGARVTAAEMQSGSELDAIQAKRRQAGRPSRSKAALAVMTAVMLSAGYAHADNLAVGGTNVSSTTGSTPAASNNTGTSGNGATAGSDSTAFNTAVGNNTNAAGGGATALGDNAQATGISATALGSASVANGSKTTGVGSGAQATGTGATAYGSGAIANGNNTVAIGNGSSATGLGAIAEGPGAVANGGPGGSVAIAIGSGARATSITPASPIALGVNAAALNGEAVAIGNSAVAQGNGSISMGVSANAAVAGTVALGGLSQATGANSIAIGNAAAASTAESTALGSGAVTRAATNVSSVTLNGVTFGGFAGATPTGVVSIGAVGQEHQLQNVAAGQVSATSTDAVNGSQLFSVASQVAALSNNLTTLTTTASANSASGPSGSVTDASDTAVGRNSVVAAQNGTAVGSGSSVTGTNSTAIGANSTATAKNSVALGANSIADRDNTVSVGSAGAERQITNVADGTAPTDAVNVRQLNSAVNGVRDEVQKYRRDANAGTASAIAMANLPQAVLPGEKVVAFGAGNYGGQSAMALGLSVATQRWMVKGSVTTAVSGHGSVGAGAGVGYRW